MEVIEVPEIKYARPDVFSIYPLGDVHMGSRQCDEDGIKKKVSQIKGQKNAYWIGMGDYADAILKNDKRFDVGGLASWVKGGQYHRATTAARQRPVLTDQEAMSRIPHRKPRGNDTLKRPERFNTEPLQRLGSGLWRLLLLYYFKVQSQFSKL